MLMFPSVPVKGQCWGCQSPYECSLMGHPSKPLNVPAGAEFFLLTQDRSPYCGEDIEDMTPPFLKLNCIVAIQR